MSANEKQIGGSHYRGVAYQHWDWVVENRLPYLEGQITKYISRWRKKNGAQDLEKALHYAEKLLEVTAFFYQRPRAKELEKMQELYQLSPEEVVVFRLVVEYQTREELEIIRDLVQFLLSRAKYEYLRTHPPANAATP